MSSSKRGLVSVDLQRALRGRRTMTGRSRPQSARIAIWLLAVLCGACGIAGVLMSLGFAGLPSVTPCGPVCVHRTLSDELAQTRQTPALAQQERQLALTELAYNPVQANAWLTLAAVDSAQHDGRLSAAGLLAFHQSYHFAPVDAEAAATRLRFAFEHWDQAPPSDRDAVLHELSVLNSAPQNRDQLKALGWKIHNPFGRVVYNLALAQTT